MLEVEESNTATYTVVLDTEPTGPVTITPSSDDTDAATASGALTFTATTWSAPQTVTVTRVDDMMRNMAPRTADPPNPITPNTAHRDKRLNRIPYNSIPIYNKPRNRRAVARWLAEQQEEHHHGCSEKPQKPLEAGHAPCAPCD